MFPSANNGNDPIFYSDQQGYNKSFFDDITPSSKQEESLLSFLHFPSPFIPYENEFEDQVFLQQCLDPFPHQQQPLSAVSDNVSQTAVNMMDPGKGGVMELPEICHKKLQNRTVDGQVPRKRSSKRDRHSKINTAQGPRDRRMRLSLKVAREFFDLQDKLGFDKASKTVEWLLIQSRHEIKRLCSSLSKMNYSCSVGTKSSACSTSECEAVSGIDENSIEGTTLEGTKAKPSKCATIERKPMPSRKTAFNALARESREKARARARERARARAREKLRSQGVNESKPGEEAEIHEMNHICHWSPFERGEESGTQSHSINPSTDLVAYEGIIDESTPTMNKWSPSTFLNHLHNPGIPQDYQFPDFHSYNRSFEAATTSKAWTNPNYHL